MSPYIVDHPAFSLDDFHQLVTDAFNTPAHPLHLASPVANPHSLASTEPSDDPSDDEHHPHPTDDRDPTPPSSSDEDASSSPVSPQSRYNNNTRRRTGHLRERSSASFAPTSTMQFSAPSPSPTLLIRRRLDSLLDPDSVLLPQFATLSPPPMTSTSGFSGATGAMNESNAKGSGGGGGFFKALKTRASHLLLRAAHPSSSKPRKTSLETASSGTTKEVVDLAHPPARVHDTHHQSPFDENYSFPPRVAPLTLQVPPNEIDAVFSSPISPIHPSDHFPHVNPSSSSTSLCFPCPPLLTPLTPVSPPRNIKPGRYATSPKALPLPSTSKGQGARTHAHTHHKDGDVSVTPEDKDKEKERERELSRRLVQMGLAQHVHEREWSRDSGHGLGMGQVLGEMKGRRGGVHLYGYGRGHRHEYGRIGEEGGERGERKKVGGRRTHSDSVPLDVLLSKDHGPEDGQVEGTGMVTPPDSPEHSRFPLVNAESSTMGRARRGDIDASVAFLEPSFVPRVSFSRDTGELVSRDYANERVGAEGSDRLGVREVRRRSASDASMVLESPSSIYPQSPRHETPTTNTIQRTARRRRSTSDASITPLRSSFSPPSPHSPDNAVPPLPKEIARRLKFTRRVDSREDARVKAISRPVFGESSSHPQGSQGPSTPPRIRIHTRLPPLNTIRANYFSHQHSYEPLNGHSEIGSYKFGGGGDASTALRTADDEVDDDRAGVYSLGLGIEFLEGELGERCPSPYVNPRPAPVPPPRGADMEEEEELQVPGYVFERRGSAASGCTTSSARSTKTLKERISSFVPSVPHMPSLWSLKQNSFSRSKLNVTLSAMPPSPSSSFEPTPTASPFAASTSTSLFTPSTSTSPFTPSTSTSTPVHVRIHPPPLSPHTSPHAKSTRSYMSNNTTFTRSTNESSELLATPRTPRSGIYYQHQSSPHLAPSSYAGPSTQPGTPSSPPRLGKRASYASRLYASRNRSELSLALGMGLGLGASGMSRTSCMDEEGLGDETELEARAIGRVLTPEVDPFMRLPIERAVSVLPGRTGIRGDRERRRGNEERSRLAESEESLSVVGEDASVTVESASDASHSTALHEGSVAASPSVSSSPPSSRRTRGRGASFLRSSLEDCRSPPPPYSPPPPPPGPSPYLHSQFVQSTFSESSSSNLSFVTSEDTCPLPDSPVLPPPSPLPSLQPPASSSSSAPVLSPLSPVSELSFSFPLP